MHYTKWLLRLLTVVVVTILAACTTLDVGRAPLLENGVRWAMLAPVNNTETPLAGGRLQAITTSLLRAAGVQDLRVYPLSSADGFLGLADRATQKTALAWARKQNARYAVLGSVQEWSYKTGLDGEPAVGVTLSIMDLQSGQVVWTGSGARTGWGRESVAGVAQELIADLVSKALANS